MNADSIRAFEKAVMQPTLEKAYPGDLVIEGITYAGSAVPGELGPVQLADGGTVITQPLYVTISKTLLRNVHELGTTVRYKNEGWKIQSSDGDSDTDSSWSYVCTRQPGADV